MVFGLCFRWDRVKLSNPNSRQVVSHYDVNDCGQNQELKEAEVLDDVAFRKQVHIIALLSEYTGLT